MIWIGKKICNPEPIKYDEARKGMLLLTLTGKYFKVDGVSSYPNVVGYESHFATCPEANQWRGKKA